MVDRTERPNATWDNLVFVVLVDRCVTARFSHSAERSVRIDAHQSCRCKLVFKHVVIGSLEFDAANQGFCCNSIDKHVVVRILDDG